MSARFKGDTTAKAEAARVEALRGCHLGPHDLSSGWRMVECGRGPVVVLAVERVAGRWEAMASWSGTISAHLVRCHGATPQDAAESLAEVLRDFGRVAGGEP